MKHPRDQFLTIYGRKPVVEILHEDGVEIEKIFLAKKAKGDIIKQIIERCDLIDVPIFRVSPEEVSRISKNPKQDQGVALDIRTPLFDHAAHFLDHLDRSDIKLLAIDGVTTPANVGMIIRNVSAFGLDGVIIPWKGTAKLNALVIKASAGTLFKTVVLRCERLAPILKKAKQLDFEIITLEGEASDTMYDTQFSSRSIFVLGNETHGVSQAVRDESSLPLSIPMSNGIESLNVACAAAVIGCEVSRRRLITP